MFRRCKHEYVNTSEFLPKDIGPCCNKCGKPLVKHEHFTYWYRVKKSFLIMASAWGRFKEIDYSEAGHSILVVFAFFLLVVGYLLAPILSITAPLIGFFGWVNVNKRLKNRVMGYLDTCKAYNYNNHKKMKDD